MEFTTYLLVNLLIIAVPLAISLWRETRYTDKWNILAYGLGSVLFGLLFFSDPNLSSPTHIETKNLALGFFAAYGALAVLASIVIFRQDIEEGWATLAFSGKYFAAFQIPFIIVQLGGTIPKLGESTALPQAMQFGALMAVCFSVASAIVWAYKNDHLPQLYR